MPLPEALRQLETNPARTRVTSLTGERINYKSARVVGDSLRDGGLSLGVVLTQSWFSAFGQDGRPVAKTHVREVEFWKFAPARTAVAAVGMGVLTWYLLSNLLTPL